MRSVLGLRDATFGLIVLFVAAACGSSAPTTSTASASGYHSPSIAFSTSAGDVIASADVAPEADSVVEGTGPDGTDYKVDIPAFALTEPTTISMRPLKPVAIPGGQLVAGVELAPEGTVFGLPVTLTITPSNGDVMGLMPFQYTGSADAATATLAITESIDAGSVQMWLDHFSGGLVAKPADLNIAARQVDPGTFPTNGSPSEQSAWAQDMIALGKWEMAKGPPADPGAPNPVEVGQDMLNRGWTALNDAEAARGNTNHDALMKLVKAGQLKDAADVTAGLVALGRKAIERASKASPCDPGATIGSALQPLLDARDEYFKNVIMNLDADNTFQQLLTDGKPTDFKYMQHLFGTFLGSMRQTQLLGRTSETDDLMNARVQEWSHTYGLNLVSKTVPSTTADWQMILGVMRQAALYGDDVVARAGPCVPPPGQTCPPHADLLPGADDARLAEANICEPQPSESSTPVEDQPVTDHVSITGHGVTDGLSSNLGNGQDGKSVADLSIEMDLRVQSVGGIVRETLLSGNYTITGSSTGDCVGTGSESGPMSTIRLYTVTDAGSNISVEINLPNDSASLIASFQYPVTCATIRRDPKNNNNPYVVQEPGTGGASLSDLSCDLSTNGGETSCQEGSGTTSTTWTVQLSKR